MQTLCLQGGFGEKGRTSIAVDDGDTCLMLDAGIKVGAPERDYHPQLARPASAIDALLITHAHEDHIGAFCWFLAQGFGGPTFMTASTRAEMMPTLSNYAHLSDLTGTRPESARIELFEPGDELAVGRQQILTGHSGHVAGGVWFLVRGGGQRVLYCGDVVPESAVFPMSPPPECDLMIVDCSYGTDAQPMAARARRIVDWVAGHPSGCVLPTPLSGRSLELLAILPGPVAIAEGMDEPLLGQLANAALLRPGIAVDLAARIRAARRWSPGSALPDCPLLVHDGMGTAGPAAAALDTAERTGHPVLLSGHLPDGSPGQRMRARGQAAWHRLPTHPTLPQNRALWAAAGKPRLLGHSCDGATLAAMQDGLPDLDVTARTGDRLHLGQERP